ncbi:hypothetical protein JW979_00165, partial [bacterium]|nr:hypothetical protein [candidate division CSSED10-310 bacterium]
MSNTLERLRALKKKKSPDVLNSTDRKSTLENLRSLIKKVESGSSPLSESKSEDLNQNGLLTEVMFEGPGQSIEDLIPGEICTTPLGKCFKVRTIYPWHHFQGNISINTVLDQDSSCLYQACTDKALKHLDFSQAIFFDTETTGLDTGAGTYIFLAGFGYFKDRSFI